VGRGVYHSHSGTLETFTYKPRPPPPEEQINCWLARERGGGARRKRKAGCSQGMRGRMAQREPGVVLAIVWLLCRPPSAGGHRPPLRTATPAEHRGACGRPVCVFDEAVPDAACGPRFVTILQHRWRQSVVQNTYKIVMTIFLLQQALMGKAKMH